MLQVLNVSLFKKTSLFQLILQNDHNEKKNGFSKQLTLFDKHWDTTVAGYSLRHPGIQFLFRRERISCLSNQ